VGIADQVMPGELMRTKLRERRAHLSVMVTQDIANSAVVSKRAVTRAFLDATLDRQEWRRLAVYLGVPT
jgi:hypothetical protein